MLMNDTDTLQIGLSWLQQGHQIVLATVIRTWGSSPRQAGAHMVIRDDGVFAGSVSGGCIENAVIQHVLDGFEGVGKQLFFGVSTETAWEVGLSCGGEIEIWLESIDQDLLQIILDAIHSRKSSAIEFFVDGSQNMRLLDTKIPSQQYRTLIQTDGRIIRSYEPSFRIFVVGAVHIAQFLITFAKDVGYEVIVIDPRDIFVHADRWSGVRTSNLFPEECFEQEQLGIYDAVVALSHNPNFDDEAMLCALKQNTFYVGALGSKKNHASRCQRLRDMGCSQEELDKICGPIGLDIGSKTPAEIAISILAEIISHQRKLCKKISI